MHGNATDDATAQWSDDVLSEETQRRLLLSQNSVTARFEAQKLWDQGYTGAKVKVGVFDTGIRADHPHVKNIRWVPHITIPAIAVDEPGKLTSQEQCKHCTYSRCCCISLTCQSAQH